MHFSMLPRSCSATERCDRGCQAEWLGASVCFRGAEVRQRVVIEVVRQNGWALQYASEELKRDRVVVIEAVK